MAYSAAELTRLRKTKGLWNVGIPMPPDQTNTVLYMRGEGIFVTDDQGNRILDAASTMFNVTLGYSCEPVKRAMREQIDSLAYGNVHKGVANPAALKLSEVLTELLAPEGLTKFFFGSGGSESNESLIKIARHYWNQVGRPGKKRLAAFDKCFHGLTMGVNSLQPEQSVYAPFGPFLPGCVSLPYPDFYRRDPSVPVEDFVRSSLQAMEDVLVEAGADEIAVLFLDPFAYASGLQTAPPSLVRGIRALCDKHEILLACDEIVTGLGRAGEWFGVRLAGVQPDLMSLSKGLTAGYFPFGVAAVHARLVHAFEGAPNLMPHGFTNCGHPVGCAAAIATIEYIKQNDVIGNVQARGDEMRALLGRKLPN